MNDRTNLTRMLGALATAVAVLILLGFVLITSGCKSSERVVTLTKDSIHADSIHHTIIQVDSVLSTKTIKESIIQRDSVAPILDSLNRVIGFERWHYLNTSSDKSQEILSLRLLIDSLRSIKLDSISMPVPVVLPAKAEKTTWYKSPNMWILVICLGTIAVIGLDKWIRYKIKQ